MEQSIPIFVLELFKRARIYITWACGKPSATAGGRYRSRLKK